MCKLKANKKKEFIVGTIYIVEEKSSNAPNPHLLPLANSLNFNLSFSILLNVISNNTPVPFL